MTVRERQQHLDRDQIELTDDHGRRWIVASEVGLDARKRPRIAPVGTFTPLFAPPHDFLPDQKFLVFDPRRPSLLSINYRAWIEQVREAHRQVKDYISRLAWQIYRDQAPKYIEQPTPEMLEIVFGTGKGPEPWEPMLAAMQGNGWILGLRSFDPSKAQDVRLKPYLDRWVDVRFRDVRWEAAPDVAGLSFGDTEDAPEPTGDEPDLTDDELDRLTQPTRSLSAPSPA